MSNPKPYDLTSSEDCHRLLREVCGYMQVSLRGGTDPEGRQFALEALRSVLHLRTPSTMPVLGMLPYIRQRAEEHIRQVALGLGITPVDLKRDLERLQFNTSRLLAAFEQISDTTFPPAETETGKETPTC